MFTLPIDLNNETFNRRLSGHVGHDRLQLLLIRNALLRNTFE